VKFVARVTPSLIALLASTIPASAQQWYVEGHAGRVRSALDPAAASSQTAMLGVRYDGALTGMRASIGIPTAADAVLWGALGAARRVAVRTRGLLAGVDFSAHGLLLHDRSERTREVPDLLGRPTLEPLPRQSGYAIAGAALPVLGFESERMQAHVRAGVSSYTSRFAEQPRERTVQLADAQISISPSKAIALMPNLRHYRAGEGDYTYAGLNASVSVGAATVWGSAGQWLARDSAKPWALGATFSLHERAALSASVRHDALDPLYLNPPNQGWTLGFSIRLNDPLRLSPPVPARYANGRATIQTEAPGDGSSCARVAGDFNDWKPQPMQRSGKHCAYTTEIAPGVYNYSFVDAKGVWFVPEQQPGRKSDGMGGFVAVLVVQ
jgi:hypothetical protein